MGTYFFKTNLMGMRALQPPGKQKENEGGYGENKVSRWFANIILFSFAILITASSDYSSGGVPDNRTFKCSLSLVCFKICPCESIKFYDIR